MLRIRIRMIRIIRRIRIVIRRIRIMLNPVEEIKNRLDVVQVVGSYLKLHKAGANFQAVCPFHSEKKPSFFVSPARQIWHCFGCQKGGDIFGFVKEIEGVEFGDALRLLAQKAGVQLKKPSPEYKEWQTERARLYEICELACRFFEKQLREGATGQEAKKYLLDRGLTEESMNKWRIGYAPDVWQGLLDFLVSHGYKTEEIIKAGLAVGQTKTFDRFRGRIIFPVFDLNSQVVGFGGRVFKSDDPAKYVNSPATLLYDKSRILYGLDKAKVEIRKRDFAILVEGYVDEILCHQAGLENAVAVSGTALTSFQLNVLKRYSQNLRIAFDMDIGGDTATKRGISLAQSQDFNIKIVTMPEGKDPADVISQDAGQWVKLVDSARSITEFYFETTFIKFDSRTADGKREISKILLPVMKRIINKIEQSHWLQELAKRLGVREEVVEKEMNKVKTVYDAPEETPRPPAVKPREELLQERVAAILVNNPQLAPDLVPPKIQAMLANTDLANSLALGLEVEEGDIDYQLELKTCLQELRNIEVRGSLSGISGEIKKAEEAKEMEKIGDLIKRFKETALKLMNI
jgi:DNA primase